MKTSVSEILPYACSRYDGAVNAFLPTEVLVSLTQDSAGTGSCVVAEGDTVKEGQVLASSPSLNGAHIHSPVPGSVTQFVVRSMPNGKKARAVQIRLQGEFSLLGKPRHESDWNSFSASALRRLFGESGIVNSFAKAEPLSVSIDTALKRNVPPVVVVRLFDDDPSRCTDSFIAEQYRNQVAEGARIVAAAAEASRVVLAYSESAVSPMPDAEPDGFIEAVPVDTGIYPCGGRHELIQQIRKKSEAESLSVSDIFIDSGTALAVYEAAVHGQPVIDTFVQVSGHALAEEGMFKVRIGTPLRYLAAECGGFVKPYAKIIINGLISGVNIADLDTPVTKYVKSVTFLPFSEKVDQRTSECLRCGNCRSVCQAGIEPDTLYAYYAHGKKTDPAYVRTTSLCSDCALCNAVCPARLPLCQTLSMMKGSADEKK